MNQDERSFNGLTLFFPRREYFATKVKAQNLSKMFVIKKKSGTNNWTQLLYKSMLIGFYFGGLRITYLVLQKYPQLLPH